ncbi:MAG: HAMP domain-containing sensor histidine kinase [Pseudomonadota bacterium]
MQDMTPPEVVRNNEPEKPGPERRLSFFRSLSAKLLLLTVIFIMLAEVLIFVPSVANYRNVWLRTHLDTAEAASIVYLDSIDFMLSQSAGKNLLDAAQATNMAVRQGGKSQLIASLGAPEEVFEHIDLDRSSAFGSIRSAFAMLVIPSESQYRVYGSMRSGDGVIELVQKVDYIQKAMWRYARNILILSLLISVFAAGLVYLALYRLIVLPIIRISTNMDDFSKAPENASLIYNPTKRNDEIGLAEHRLSSFQHDLQNTLRQKQRLADLGLAVAKINHDLRNILASAQLFSDRLSALPDPTVQRFAPKLIRTIDRAVDYTKSVIDYGKALESPPKKRPLLLHSIVNDVAELLGLERDPNLVWYNNVDPEMMADADPEQLFRILMNLCRNAQQAMADADYLERVKTLGVDARTAEGEVQIRVRDTGPGIPEHVREKIFNAFQGSTKSGGTGLGMSIAYELVTAHGGRIEVEETGSEGTVFLVAIPVCDKEHAAGILNGFLTNS